MSLRNAINAARATMRNALEDAYGEQVQINGAPFTGALALGRIKPEMDIASGTTRHVQTLRFDLRKTDLAVCPKEQTKLRYGGKEWWIESTSGQRPESLVWVLNAKRSV